MMINNLDIYFSDACQGNCAYCILKNNPQNNNTAIRQALSDGSFARNVRKVLTPEIQSLGLWGMEPSINGEYFSKFIISILDYDPYIRYILIPTSAQSTTFYQDFIAPLVQYCNTHKRKLIVQVQVSLDGPAIINDAHRGEGTTRKAIDLIQTLCMNFPAPNKYMRLRIATKSTLRAEDLSFSPRAWHNYMFQLFKNCLTWTQGKWIQSDIYVGLTPPTLEVPGNYTKEDGKNFARWAERFPIAQSKWIDTNKECLAGTTSITIDYQGNLYDCHLLVNKDIDNQLIRQNFENTMNRLVANNEVIEQDHDALFNAIMSIYCWAAEADQNNIPESYLRLLGNGAIL